MSESELSGLAQPDGSTTAARGQPTVAIVIPVYKQPQFLAEAVASALDQRGAVTCRIVIVDDGCPMPNTSALGLSFAFAYARIRYVRTPNRGLSAARNAGIACALATWPEIEAIYLLDADNRLTPSTIARGLAALEANPEASWVYPQLNKFGMTWSGHVAVPVSPLHLLFAGSFMEASSLIHRRIFDAGLRYDESLRIGFEDWEFWLQAFARGFHGICAPEMGLDYRYRPESMVRNAARQRAALLGELRRRHPALYAAPALLTFEQEFHPRYAQVCDENVVFFTDPRRVIATLGFDDWSARLWHLLAEPERTGVPPYLLWADPRALEHLLQLKVVQAALRRLEAAADAGEGVAAMVLEMGEHLDFAHGGERGGTPVALMLQTQVFVRALTDPVAERELVTQTDSACRIRVTLPPSSVELLPRRSVMERLRDTLATCRARQRGWEVPKRWHWQSVTLPTAADLVAQLRTELGGAPLSNVAREMGRSSVCCVLERGSLERLPAIERFLQIQGHGATAYSLLVVGPVASGLPVDRSQVATLDLSPLPQDEAGFRFLGEPFALPPPEAPAWSEIRGALAGFQTLILTVAKLFPLLAEWRARGTQTFVLTRDGRPSGEDHLILAFEHAIDLLLVSSAQDARSLSARGFPATKIVAIDW